MDDEVYGAVQDLLIYFGVTNRGVKEPVDDELYMLLMNLYEAAEEG